MISNVYSFMSVVLKWLCFGTHILHWIPSWKQRAPKLKNIFNVAWVVIYFILHTGFQGRGPNADG